MKSKSITDIGSKRKVNQDYIYNKDDGIGLLSNLYIVADGMGGHKAGDYASRECVNSIVGYIEEHTECYTPISLLENAIINANNNINEQSNNNPELEGMGTTIVAATIVDNTMYVANVGDSRLYLIRDDKMEQITEDHSLVEEMVKRGEITPTDAKMHPNKNIITSNKFGLTGIKKNGKGYCSKFTIEGHDINIKTKYDLEEAKIDNLIAQRYLGFKHNEDQFYKLEGLSEERIKEVTDNLDR